MGRDKCLLELGGLSLLQRAINLALCTVPQVRVVGDPAKYGSFGQTVADLYRDRGPLGGIHAALASTGTDLNLILAADLPFVEQGFLKKLVEIAQTSDALVTVPSIGGYFEPLCAVYRKQFKDIAQTALSENRNKVDALFSATITRIATEADIVRAGFKPAMFRNLNTPEDLAQAEKALSE